jgi:phospholipase/carboxylesterase
VPLLRIDLPPRSGPPSQTLVLLHGYGANEHDLLGLGHELDPSFRVISLAAPLTLPWGGRAWYNLTQSGGGSIGWDPAEVAHAAAVATEEIAAIAKGTGAPPLVLGFSQGAGMALLAALRSPGSVRGVIALSAVPPDRAGGLEFADAASTKGLPIFLGHGTHDPLLPIAAAWRSRALLEEKGCDVTYREYPMAHEISLAELADVKALLKHLPPWPRTP